MNIQELIYNLVKYSPDEEVMVFNEDDGSNQEYEILELRGIWDPVIVVRELKK